jgi:hypothetical protein
MSSSRSPVRILRQSVVGAAIAVATLGVAQDHTAAKSQWVYFSRPGKLAYQTLKTGDRIIDFSYAGYMGGGVALPVVPVRKTVAPSGNDDTASIQAAIDEVSNLPLVQGLRGAVMLLPGRFHCKGMLTVRANGVVLRGSGSNERGTVMEMTGDPHLAIAITGEKLIKPLGAATTVSDAYVPAGSMSFNVRDVSGFNVGDTVEIVRPTTAEWVRFMGMDTLARNGKKEIWVGGDTKTERRIVAISGKRLQFDVPLADSYNAKYLGIDGTKVAKIEHTGQVEQVGVEDLRLVAPARTVTLNDKHFNGLELKSVKDGWVNDLSIANTTGPVNLDNDTRRVTVENVNVTQSIALVGAAKSADFSVDGTQILIDRCSATEDNVFYIATGARQQGPNVVLHCVFHGDGHVQPHQRWSTALLVDGCRVPEGGIDLMNRGEMGSGHGWTMGWGVAWNNEAKSYVIQMPPGSANWGIGNRGEQTLEKMPTFDPGQEVSVSPQGFIDSQESPVAPASLYLEQLRERLGAQALKNIGY